MQIWKDNELNRAYQAVIFSRNRYIAQSSSENWELLLKAVEFYKKCGGKVSVSKDIQAVYIYFEHT